MSKRLISKPEVLDRTGNTFPTIWKWMIAGTFPRCREVGGKSMWLEDEVEAWIDARPVRPLKGEKGAGIAHKPYAPEIKNPRRLGNKKSAS
jgi:predicted DNA-binding transcriptional regulator AlpA